MKFRSFGKFWVVFVLLIIVLSIPGQVIGQAIQSHLSIPQAVQDPQGPVGVVNTGALNLRQGPGVEFSKVTVIYKGQVVALLGRWATNNWVKVRLYSGTEGWVNSVYLTTSVPVSQLQVLGGAPTPTPTPLPVQPATPIAQPTAVVTSGVLNVRSGPSVSFAVVDVVYQGQQLVLIGRNESATWVNIRTPDNTEGWVNAGLVQTSIALDSLPVVDNPIDSPTAVVTTGAVNVRSGPGLDYSVVTILYQGQSVALIGRTNNSSWLKVDLVNDQDGWLNSTTVQTNVPIPSLPVAEVPPPPNAAVVNVSWLNVRLGPGTNFDAFTVLQRGQVVGIIGRSANSTWVKVRLPNNSIGWVDSNYLLGSTPLTELPIVSP
ncbi:MAG: SH3 domain-containing protein [Chloroflexota bacterium]|jgi:uncharacterized protein YgiM (DUF1202 family)